jgi:hypothetical protein
MQRQISALVATGSGCTQTSPSDMVEPTGLVSFRCEGQTASSGRYYIGSVSAATTSWLYRINGGSWQSSGSQVPTQSTLNARSILPFTIDLRPTTAVTPGTSGSVSVSVSYQACFLFFCGEPVSDYTATLQATRPAVTPTAADLLLSCTPATVGKAVNQPQTISCTYSGRPSLGVRQVTLTEIVVPMPAGWSISSEAGTVTGSTLTLRPNAVISYSATTPQSHAFTFEVTPSCTSSTTNQPVSITSRFAFGTASGIAGATFPAQAARTASAPLTVSVQGNSLAWNQPFDLSSTVMQGTLRYRVVAASCSGWNVQVSASSFAYAGPNNAPAIPATHLQLTTSGVPIVIAGSGNGVTTTGATGSIATPKKVLSAPAGVGVGTFEQTLSLTLTVPARSLAGTYTSTITMTSTAAP